MNSTELNPESDSGDQMLSPNLEWERVTREFGQYFKEQRVGSPRVLALADNLELRKSYAALSQVRDYVKDLKIDQDTDITDYAHPSTFKSMLRVAELVHSGVLLRIQERKAALPEYILGFNMIDEWEDEMNAIQDDMSVDKGEREIDPDGVVEFFDKTLVSLLSGGSKRLDFDLGVSWN